MFKREIDEVFHRMMRQNPYKFVANGYHDFLGRRLELSYKSEVLDNFIFHLRKREFGGKAIMDVGCGTGDVGDYFHEKGFRTINVDISEEALRLNNSKKELIQSTLMHNPLKNDSVAGIHVKDVIVHVPDKRSMLEEFERLLIPGGVVCITTAELAGIPFKIEGLPYFSTKAKNIIELAHQAGLDLVSFGGWTPYEREFDWYREEYMPRNVLMFSKKKSGIYT